ncbi:hypothetical protein Tco_0534887 [Tanacetum coccineum]
MHRFKKMNLSIALYGTLESQETVGYLPHSNMKHTELYIHFNHKVDDYQMEKNQPLDKSLWKSTMPFTTDDSLPNPNKREKKSVKCIVVRGCSRTSGDQFLGDKLVSWMQKKQNCTVMSSQKARVRGVICKCAQVKEDEDTSLRLRLYCKQNTVYCTLIQP